MSPLTLRRFRAERLLQGEFERLRGSVLSSVRVRLGRGGALDDADLEACYAQAWHGLYASLLDGQAIENPAGWLVVATYRRAIEECRSPHAARRAPAELLERCGDEQDLAGRIDDERRLRSLFEGMRLRLSDRECQAASLCYLQGLSRAEAARRMGISERRMRKLMEGDGQRKRGVAGKVGELMESIRLGRWCEEQGSLMRALAFGMLDPGGERFAVARSHQESCAACRRYVLSLRGMAAVMPPLLLPHGVVAGAAGGAGAGAGAAAGGGVGSGAAGFAGGGVAVAPAAFGAAGASLAGKLLGFVALVGVAAGGLAISSAGSGRRGAHGAGSGGEFGVAGGDLVIRRSNAGGQARRASAGSISAVRAGAGVPGAIESSSEPLAGARVAAAEVEFGIEAAGVVLSGIVPERQGGGGSQAAARTALRSTARAGALAAVSGRRRPAAVVAPNDGGAGRSAGGTAGRWSESGAAGRSRQGQPSHNRSATNGSAGEFSFE